MPNEAKLAVLWIVCLCAPSALGFGHEIYYGPDPDTSLESWRDQMLSWAEDERTSANYQGGVFGNPALQWTQLDNWISVQMHPYDKYFYNADTSSYTVAKYINDTVTRYGGLDSLLFWPTYTNIGCDDRNQYDLFRALPGGLDMVKNLTEALNAAGIRVIWPYNPWDTNTRDEGSPDPEVMAKLTAQTGAQGVNGDTMTDMDPAFYTDSVQQGDPLALEPEGGGDIQTLKVATNGWGYFKYPFIQGVDRMKLLDSRRVTHVCNRWAKNRTDDLQAAFFNGAGYVAWENVWGIWNGIVPSDGEAIRRIGTILRYFGHKGYLISKHWRPHDEAVLQRGAVFASAFPASDEESLVYLLVNRDSRTATGKQLRISSANISSSASFYDCYHGEQLTPDVNRDGNMSLSFEVEGNGYGCVFATESKPEDLDDFLAKMHEMTQKPLSSYSKTWHYLEQTMDASMQPASSPHKDNRTTVNVAQGTFNFVVSGVEIEGTDADGVDVQYPWESQPSKEHSHQMSVGPFHMDKFPVTNDDYARYLEESGYTPRDDYNFLKHWQGNSVPPGMGNKPVTYVSFREAKEYCAFYGKRLPQDYEWQYAAQGNDGRLYPWGNSKDQARFPTPVHDARTNPVPADVDAFIPGSESPFGVADLVGNVWQYTSSFQDAHTRAVILRGASAYVPTSSKWYFPTALELNLHNKYFLMDDSYERAGTVGFRCLADQ